MNEKHHYQNDVKLFFFFTFFSLISFFFRILLRYYNYDLYFNYFVPVVPNYEIFIGLIFSIFQLILIILSLYFLFRLRTRNFMKFSVFIISFIKSLGLGMLILILGKFTLFYIYGLLFNSEIQLNAFQNTLNEFLISLVTIYVNFYFVSNCLNMDFVINNFIRKISITLKSYFIFPLFILLNLKFALFYLLNFKSEFYILIYGLFLTTAFYLVYLIMFAFIIDILKSSSKENYFA